MYGSERSMSSKHENRVKYIAKKTQFKREQVFSLNHEEGSDWIVVPRIPHTSAKRPPQAHSSLRKCKQNHQKRLNAKLAKQSGNYF